MALNPANSSNVEQLALKGLTALLNILLGVPRASKAGVLITVWHSLVVFRSLNSVCKAWQIGNEVECRTYGCGWWVKKLRSNFNPHRLEQSK